MLNKLKIWFRATRPFSFTASLIPVIVGSVLLKNNHIFSIFLFVVSLFTILFLHIAANLISDSDDYIKKVDTKKSLGSSGVIVEGLLRPKKVLHMGYNFLFLAFIGGIFLFLQRGMPILYFGLAGVLGGFFYSRKPFSFKYRGLGTPLVFLMFGPLPVIGSYFVQTKLYDLKALLISIPIGLLTVAILHSNDIRDIKHDTKAKIKTFSIIIGKDKAKIFYLALLAVSYLFIIFMIVFGQLNLWSLIVFITLPIAVKNIKKLFTAEDIATIDKETAMLQLSFGVLLVISLLV